MARTTAEIISDIQSFRPEKGWRELDNLVSELFAQGTPENVAEPLLEVFEKFPDEDGAGVFWSIVHGLEALPYFQAPLIESVQRNPTEFSLILVNRLLNGGVSIVNGVSLIEALRRVSEAEHYPESVRESARDFLEYQEARP